VVVEHGTVPLDDIFHDMRESAINNGTIDYDHLIANQPQPAPPSSPETGSYQLFRIGDAVSSRNIHAAIYDGIRLCKDL
jgi:hypothetical protein